MKILHNLLKGVSLTSALFVFQACYGIPEPPMYEEGGVAPMSFTVVSHADGTPLEGITVKDRTFSGSHQEVLGVTDANGQCSVQIPYRRNLEGPFLRFEGDESKFFAKDTSLTDLRERNIVIRMDPVL